MYQERHSVWRLCDGVILQVCSAKGALTARMPARTTVIAAANPTGGVYTHAKSLQENAKMTSALFSRFDLTFGLTDDADTEQDQYLSAHVMRVHCKGGSTQLPCV